MLVSTATFGAGEVGGQSDADTVVVEGNALNLVELGQCSPVGSEEVDFLIVYY